MSNRVDLPAFVGTRPSKVAAACFDSPDIFTLVIPRLDQVSQMHAVHVSKWWQRHTITVVRETAAGKLNSLIDFLISNLDRNKYARVCNGLQTHISTQTIVNSASLMDIKQNLLLVHYNVALFLRDVDMSDLQPLQRQLERIVCATTPAISLWELVSIYKKEQIASALTYPLQKKRAYCTLVQDLINHNLLSDALIIAQRVDTVFVKEPLFEMIAIKWAKQGQFYKAFDIACRIQDPTCRRAAFAWIGIELTAHPSFGEYASLVSQTLEKNKDRAAFLQFVILKLLEQKRWPLAIELSKRTSQELLEHVITIVVPALLESQELSSALKVATMSLDEGHLMHFAVLFAKEGHFSEVKSSFIYRIDDPAVFARMIIILAAIDLEQTFTLVIQHPNISLKETGLAALVPYLANQRQTKDLLAIVGSPITDRVAKNYAKAVLAFGCIYTGNNKEAYKWAQDIDDLQLKGLLLTLIGGSFACQGNTRMALGIEENANDDAVAYDIRFVIVLNLFYRRKVAEAYKFAFDIDEEDLQRIAIFLALEDKFDIADQVISLLPDEEKEITQKIVSQIKNHSVDLQNILVQKSADLHCCITMPRRPHLPQISPMSFESAKDWKDKIVSTLIQDLNCRSLWDQSRQIIAMISSSSQQEAFMQQINMTEQLIRDE